MNNSVVSIDMKRIRNAEESVQIARDHLDSLSSIDDDIAHIILDLSMALDILRQRITDD